METHKRNGICCISQSHMIKLFCGIQVHIFSSSCPFPLPPLEEKGSTLSCFRGQTWQSSLTFVSNSNRGRGKRGLGEGVGSKGRDTCSLSPPPVPEVRAFPGVSNLTKDRGPQAQQQQGTQVKALCR